MANHAATLQLVQRGLQWEATRYHYFRNRGEVRNAEAASAAYYNLRSKLPPEEARHIPFLK